MWNNLATIVGMLTLATLSQGFVGVCVKFAQVPSIGYAWTRSLSRAGALRGRAASDGCFHLVPGSHASLGGGQSPAN